MNLRVKKKKGENQNKEREIIITTKMPKNRRQKKPTNHKNTPETSDQPAELNALDVLLERFFSPEKNSVVEEEEELNNMRKRKVIVNDGKMVKKGKRTKRFNNNNNNKVQERDGNVDLALGTGRIEDEDGIVARNAGDNNSELNYEECARTQNTKDVASSSTNPSNKRKGRGPTTLLNITEDTSGVRIVVEYNGKGQPVGPVGSKFSSFLGILGRRMVPIIYETWHKVPKELKERIWNRVEAKYVIDSKRRKNVISSIGERFRTFKGNLTKYYINPFKHRLELLNSPPKIYNFIRKEHWDAFVKSRLTEEFQKNSKCQAERRAKNIYNHRLSRKGYAGLVEELKQSLGTSVDELDRCVLWKKARQNKEGVYVDDAVREKAEHIDELTKQSEEGSIVIEGDRDILTLALGTSEHSGRVRGVGQFVTPTTYFNLPRRNSSKYVGELEGKINQQANKILEMNQIVQDLQAQFDGILPEVPPTTPSSEKISSNANNTESRKHLTTTSVEYGSFKLQGSSGYLNDDQPLHLALKTDWQLKNKGNTEPGMPPPESDSRIGKSKQCRLALDFKTNIVARGIVFDRTDLEEKIHNVQLRETDVRVAVEYAVSPDSLLPIPVIGEMTMVKHAIGSCVAWPKEFVLTGVEEEENQDDGDKSGPIQAFASLIDQIMSTNNIVIPIQSAIFEGEEVECAHLDKPDLVHLCNMQDLTAGCIITYISFLYDKSPNYQERYGFVNPAAISCARGSDASFIITKRLQAARKDQLLFIPYKTRGHWILIVIDTSSMDVYWLDPMQKPISIDVKIYVTSGLKALQGDGKRRPNPTWHCVKCPKQPVGVECGYYLMRYMRELMEGSDQPFSEMILQFAEKSSYSQDELDEVRLELIDFILAQM